MKTFATITILAHLLGATVHACVVTAVGEGWLTKAGVQCAGHLAGTTYTVTWTDANGTVTGTATKTASTNAPVTIEAPAGVSPGDTFTVTNDKDRDCNETGTQIALLDPPATTAEATHILTGGTAAALGETFNLTGGFQVRADSLDKDPISPSYGELSGAVSATGFSIVGTSTSTTRTFRLQLLADQPYATNLSGVLDSPWLEPESTFFETQLFGNLIIDENPAIAFEGVAWGQSDYMVGPGSPETYTVGFTLATELGDFTGSFVSEGTVKVYPKVISPVLLGIGFDAATETATLTYKSTAGVTFDVLGGDSPDNLSPLEPTQPGDGSVRQYTHRPPGNPPRYFYRFSYPTIQPESQPAQ